jgi:uncharacterized protein (UPF0261 family)
MIPTIVVAATLDTKSREALFLKEAIEKHGCRTLSADLGVFDQSVLKPDVSRHEVARAAGTTIDEILDTRDRYHAVTTMRTGAFNLFRDLHRERDIAGIAAIGGGTGTNIASGAVQALPVGIPKLVVSTVASRDMSDVIGSKDVTIMHSVSDLIGLNFLTVKTLSEAAAAIAAMVQTKSPEISDRLAVGLTSYGPLNPCALTCTELLTDLGYEVIPFHAIGAGSMAMEALVSQGAIHGVLDLTLHEFADSLHGGYCGRIGPERLTSGGPDGTPRVVLPGGLDMVVFECTAREGIPEPLRDRIFVSHDFRSFVRTTAQDMYELAEMIADRLNAAHLPPTVIVPTAGWSKADCHDGPFYDPVLNNLFVNELRSRLSPDVIIAEVKGHINDRAVAEHAVNVLHELMQAAFPNGRPAVA